MKRSESVVMFGLLALLLVALGGVLWVVLGDQAGSNGLLRDGREASRKGAVKTTAGDKEGAAGDLEESAFRFPFDERFAALVEELRRAIYARDQQLVNDLLQKNPGLLQSSISMCLEIVETEGDDAIASIALRILKRLWQEEPPVEQVILNAVLERLFEVMKSSPSVNLRIELVQMLARKRYLPARDTILAMALDRSLDESLQIAALEVLHFICDDGCLPDVLALLTDATDSPAIRHAILRLLAHYKSDLVVTHLLEMATMDDTRKGELLELIKTLGLLGDGRAAELLNSIALDTQRPEWLRVEAVRSLYLLGTDEAVDHLSALFKGDPDATMRFEALHKMGRLGGEIEDPDLRQRLQEELIAVLDGQTANRHRDIAARSLIYSGEPEHVDKVLDALRRNENLDPAMLQKYAAHGKEGYLDKLQTALDAESSDRLKVALVDALGRSQDPRAVDSLMDLLRREDESDLVKEQAVHALAWIKDAKPLPDLRRLALSSPAVETRVAAVSTIGDIGGSQALAILEELARSEDLSVRMAASGQLERVKAALGRK
jgi:HEAT repeat protein